MGFFDKIASFFGAGSTETDGNQSKPSSNDNSISAHNSLMGSIEGVMKRNFKGQKFSFNDKVLRLWVTDNIRLESLSSSDFTDALQARLDSQLGFAFARVEMHEGPLPETNDFTKVEDGVFMEIYLKGGTSHIRKAEISVIRNCGSLLMQKYTLDSKEIEELPSKRYNIGAGEYPEISGRFRHNHIAIDDSPESEGYEHNKYVSRTHAYIRYVPSCGFMLQAEAEGTAKAGMRTRIFRADTMIEVDDIVPQPLMDGDCIELNKNVRLLFKMVNS